MHRIAADGAILEGDLYLTRERFSYNDLAWNGAGFGWVFQRKEPAVDLFFQRLDRLGNRVGPEVRLTDHRFSGGFAQSPRILWKGAGRGYGLIWADKSAAVKQIWFASLNENGTVVTPPGLVQVSLADSWGVTEQPDFAWTGAEYLVVWPELTFPQSCGVGGRIKGARVSEAGVVLERKTLARDICSASPRIAWNGKFFGMAIQQHQEYPWERAEIGYLEIGCRCQQDVDGDGIISCSRGDCDDSDPSVGSTKPEICTDVKDNDCDGLVDCNDPNCVQTGSAPGEITGIAWSVAKDSFSWSSDALATKYDVSRGVLSDLRDMENFRWAACLASKITATSVADAEVPAAGGGFYYLVRGRTSTCLLGTWGSVLGNDTIRECP